LKHYLLDPSQSPLDDEVAGVGVPGRATKRYPVCTKGLQALTLSFGRSAVTDSKRLIQLGNPMVFPA
jgi:hypothetical protein